MYAELINWFKVARNLGADGPQMLRRIILPAVMSDVMAGIRLAVGVAWVVLVPAEYLGVTKDTIRSWIKKTDIPAHKIGRLWKFKFSEVDEWVKSGKSAL